MIHQHSGADPKVSVSPFCGEGTGFHQRETSHGYRTLPHPLRGQAFSEVADSHERNRINFLKEKKNNKKLYTSQGKLSKSLCAIRKGLLGIEQTKSFVCLMETVAVGCGEWADVSSLHSTCCQCVGEQNPRWSHFTVLQESSVPAVVPSRGSLHTAGLLFFIIFLISRVFPKAPEGDPPCSKLYSLHLLGQKP